MSEILDRPRIERHHPSASAIGFSGGNPARAPARVGGSRFETMARLSRQHPAVTGDVLGVLLDAARPSKRSGCATLQPLWTEEAIHRAHSLMRLAGGRSQPRNLIVAGVEAALARDLAAQFKSLEDGSEREIRPCSQILRDVVADLCALFGTTANVVSGTTIERVALPAYKRRALVLAAAELVSNALLHGFAGRPSGRIEVSLRSFGPRHAILRVIDDGVGFGDRRPNLSHGVAAGLASLLEADLTYQRNASCTTAEILFRTREPF